VTPGPAPVGIVPREALNALRIKRVLGRDWSPPDEYGDDCWCFSSATRTVIVSGWREPDGVEWIHASISCINGDMPDYADLKLLHRAAFGDGHAYQCFVPADQHINLTENVLHLWGKLDGSPALPEFGRFGSI
jgi:hypothetical protein